MIAAARALFAGAWRWIAIAAGVVAGLALWAAAASLKREGRLAEREAQAASAREAMRRVAEAQAARRATSAAERRRVEDEIASGRRDHLEDTEW